MNKTALITGSGRKRVGNVIARALAQDGYDIAIHYHQSQSEAETTVRELEALGVRAAAFAADVGDAQQVEAMFQKLSQRFERLDVLVNTASIWQTIPFAETTSEDLFKSFAVNALGTFFCSRAAGLWMAQQDTGGCIVTIGDWAIDRPYLDHAAYFIAKGTIPTMTRMLAVELANRNPKVRVNCLHPGPVMFPEESSAQERAKMIESTLVKDGDCPEAIAEAVKFLIANQFVTGVCLPIDGGRSIFTPVQFHEKSI
jgi:pteridine reductase